MKTSEIPDFPKLDCNFDILELSDKISVKLESDSLNKLITNEIISSYINEMHYHKRTIIEYIKKKQYPLPFLKFIDRYYKGTISNIVKKNNPVYLCKWKKVKIPEYINPKLAYFVGYLQGDGSIESNQKRINFSDEYLSQIQRINDLCFELFCINGLIEEKITALSLKPFYRLEIGSVVLNSYFHKMFNINRGIKKDLAIHKLFFQDEEILKWYIIGLFDADGTLPKNPEKTKQLFVDITMKDECFIKEIKIVLDSFGIKTLSIYCRKVKSPSSEYISKTYELRIRKREDIIIFLKRIGFSHPDKSIRAEKVLNMRL